MHRDNVPWIVANGMHCRNAGITDPDFVTIGNPDLIESRRARPIPHTPHGTLSDYVPFYFTPYSPMLLNITTGFNGVRRCHREEIVIFVSSLGALRVLNIPFLFTDRHANLATARFSSDVSDLEWIDWTALQRRDFKRDPEDPGKFERYQAEALIYKHLPISGVSGIICANDHTANSLKNTVNTGADTLKIISRPGL